MGNSTIQSQVDKSILLFYTGENEADRFISKIYAKEKKTQYPIGSVKVI